MHQNRHFKRIICLSCFFLFIGTVASIGQTNILDKKISIQLKNADLITVLETIQSKSTISFAYSSNILPKKKNYTLQYSSISIKELLPILLQNTELNYRQIGDQVIISKKKYYEIYGIIRDKSTNDALTAASVYVMNKNIGISTNDYGYYSLKLPEGKHVLIFSFLGMNTSKKMVEVGNRQRIDVALTAEEIELDEVIVNQPLQSDGLANAPLNQSSMMNLSKNTPHIGGEPDLLHVIRAQAGVQSSAGGIGGLYVRGGNTGHNLVLLDGVPVYNWMHLLGMNSIFNPEAVRGVQFHTSGFSARYGGRLSSVLDIQSREGNPEKFSGMAGINARSYHGHISGPLGNDKGAFWIGGRRSYWAPYVRNILSETFFPEGTNSLEPRYYDINIKFNRQFGLNDRLYLSYYRGDDQIYGETIIDIEEEDGEEVVENNLNYGNTIASFRWNHIYGKHLFSNLTLNYSDFFNEFQYLNAVYVQDEEQEFVYWNIQSNNIEGSIKLDYDWILKKHHVKFGGAAHVYGFQPFLGFYDENSEEIPEFDSLDVDSFSNFIQTNSTGAFETALYVEDEIHLSDRMNLRLGVRLSSFFGEDAPLYTHLEPRFLLNIKLADDFYAAFSATKMVQYLHLISNTDIGLPQDLWFPTGSVHEPAVAWQYGIDVQKTIENSWRIKGAVYYKSLQNIITLPDELTPVDFGKEITDQLLVGNGVSIGGEISAYYQEGNWTGFGAYTLSRTERQFENLNLSNPYPFLFDSRHYLQFLLNYKLNKDWSIGFRGHLSSPRPQLISSNGSLERGLQLVTSHPRNNNRGTPEHRVDLNINYFKKTIIGTNRWLEHRLSVDLYNLYNKSNPVFYYGDNITTINKPGLDLPFMLSAYYSVKF